MRTVSPTSRWSLPTFAAVVLAVMALTASCSGTSGARGPSGPSTTPVTPRNELAASLIASKGCGDLLGWIKSEAGQRVETFGGPPQLGDVRAMDRELSPGTNSKGGSQANSAAPSTLSTATATGTNNQVSNVDEGDHVKIDGDRLIVLSGRTLAVLGLTPDLPKVGAVELPADATEFLIVNGKVITIGTTYAPDGRIYTALSQVNIASVPTVEFSTTVDGSPISTRLANGAMRIVISNPQLGSGVAFTPGAVEPNRAAIGSSTLEQWLPARSDEGRRSTLVDCATALRPASFSGFGSLTILTIAGELNALATVSIMAGGQTVYANDNSLYVATMAEPIANATDYRPATDVHRFDISGTDTARYEGSGRVAGTVLNQYSMDEKDDILRIATTEGGFSGGGGFRGGSPTGDVMVSSGGGSSSSAGSVAADPVSPDTPTSEPAFSVPRTTAPETVPDTAPDTVPQPSNPDPAPTLTIPPIPEPCEGPAIDCAPVPSTTTAGQPPVPTPVPEGPSSRVTTLALDGAKLVERGHLAGIGKGETIQSVRFEGTLASIVTFRQVDPLFSIDLSDPAAPKLLGELKVPGFSNYLHPLGAGRLLGVGVGGDANGLNGSAKVSLFDNSSPATPREITSWTSPSTNLIAGSDPHSFSWDADSGLAIMVGNWGTSSQSGAIVLKVSGDTLVEIGRIVSDANPRPSNSKCCGYLPQGITRAFVHAGSIYGIADRQALSFDLAAKRTGAVTF